MSDRPADEEQTLTEQTSPSPLWFREPIGTGLEILYRYHKLVFSGQSRFQEIAFVDTQVHGRMLFLDGICQSSENDEFIYHEMLVHPTLFSHPEPRSVLVVGGATGASLREIFRHPGIERVVMVDIDGELIELCKRYAPQWHRGNFGDPRLELLVEDGRKYLERSSEIFDCVILDLSDPFESSPALLLFTREFYELVRSHLGSLGTVAVQAQGISPEEASLHARITNTIRSVFPVVRPYPYTLHSFHRPDAHVLASRDPHWSPEALVRRAEKTPLPLRYFSPEIARGMFNLPPYLHRAYETSTELLSDDLVLALKPQTRLLESP
jgi:spermidine synthase